ncbi:MAG: zinc ABC transporter substrate-binding protein [Acidobacteria bacterium]|nr:zinc ABC transporter substrate-binding protein [Acidobacteriota bacterium]
MKKPLLTVLLAVGLASAASGEPIRVVTSIPDFGAIAAAIGGADVTTESIVKGNRDVHAVELLPSLMMKVRKADVYVKVGLDLDLWAQQIIDGSRNPRLLVVDASERIVKLEVPDFKVDASHGDLHAHGNPHYWLDPANARPIGEAILAALATIEPGMATTFRANLDGYVARLDAATAVWQSRLAPHAGAEVISFHSSWPYFARRFGITIVEHLEPKPGVPPTPTHVAALTELLRTGRVKAILMESYFDDRVPAMLSRTTGVPLVKVPVLVGSAPGIDDQFALFEEITGSLARALAGGRPAD